MQNDHNATLIPHMAISICKSIKCIGFSRTKSRVTSEMGGNDRSKNGTAI